MASPSQGRPGAPHAWIVLLAAGLVATVLGWGWLGRGENAGQTASPAAATTSPADRSAPTELAPMPSLLEPQQVEPRVPVRSARWPAPVDVRTRASRRR